MPSFSAGSVTDTRDRAKQFSVRERYILPLAPPSTRLGDLRGVTDGFSTVLLGWYGSLNRKSPPMVEKI